MPFGIKIVSQNHVGLKEMLGKYQHEVQSGLQFYIPLIQKIRTVSLAMTPLALPNYSVITKDNADVQVSVTLNYHVTNAPNYMYENTDSVESMAQLVRGHLRDIIGTMDLNQALGSTSEINAKLADAIGDLTNIYGINVDRVNIDELTPSKSIQEAMDKQLTADRERVAAIAKAEGEAQSINLTIKAKNDAIMSTAKAEAQATKLRADAEQYRIEVLQTALNEVTPAYFQHQSIEAFGKLANGPANTIVLNGEQNYQLGQIPAFGKLFSTGEQKNH